MMRDDYSEHWREWVGHEFNLEQPKYSSFTDWEGYTMDSFGNQPVKEFADWFEENEELLEEDFEGLDFTSRLLIKDWLSQAYEAGRE
jgi:hypothetical protein